MKNVFSKWSGNKVVCISVLPAAIISEDTGLHMKKSVSLLYGYALYKNIGIFLPQGIKKMPGNKELSLYINSTIALFKVA